MLAIAGKYDELLKALKLKAHLEQSGNAEGMYEKALLSLRCDLATDFYIGVSCLRSKSPKTHASEPKLG